VIRKHCQCQFGLLLVHSILVVDHVFHSLPISKLRPSLGISRAEAGVEAELAHEGLSVLLLTVLLEEGAEPLKLVLGAVQVCLLNVEDVGLCALILIAFLVALNGTLNSSLTVLLSLSTGDISFGNIFKAYFFSGLSCLNSNF